MIERIIDTGDIEEKITVELETIYLLSNKKQISLNGFKIKSVDNYYNKRIEQTDIINRSFDKNK